MLRFESTVLMLTLYMSLSSACSMVHTVATVPSPDDTWLSIVREGKAAGMVNTSVTLLKKGSASDSKMVFIVAASRDQVKVKWSDSTRLTISCYRCNRGTIGRQELQWEGVAISYDWK